MGKFNIGEVWWTQFPFEDIQAEKHRPAIVIDDDTIAVLTMMVTSKDKDNPYSIKITDWKEAGLKVESWARIDRIIKMDEWRMDRKIGDLTERDLIKFMQLIAEITMNKFHEFSLVAVKNDDGKLLQVFDDRWETWLFPYCKSSDANKENVDNFISKLLDREIETSYVAVAKHCKYSVSDKVYKIYNHKLYQVSIECDSNIEENDTFDLNEKKLCWMSIEDLETNSQIMEVNDDVIAFVKTKCKL